MSLIKGIVLFSLLCSSCIYVCAILNRPTGITLASLTDDEASDDDRLTSYNGTPNDAGEDEKAEVYGIPITNKGTGFEYRTPGSQDEVSEIASDDSGPSLRILIPDDDDSDSCRTSYNGTPYINRDPQSDETVETYGFQHHRSPFELTSSSDVESDSKDLYEETREKDKLAELETKQRRLLINKIKQQQRVLANVVAIENVRLEKLALFNRRGKTRQQYQKSQRKPREKWIQGITGTSGRQRKVLKAVGRRNK